MPKARKYIPNASREAADKARKSCPRGKEGFQRKAKIDPEAVRKVVEIRGEFGTPKKTLGADISRYFDERRYRQAVR